MKAILIEEYAGIGVGLFAIVGPTGGVLWHIYRAL